MGRLNNCQNCGESFTLRRSGANNKYCSRACYWAWMKGKQPPTVLPIMWGKDNPNWKENASYSAIHYWIKRNFGKADHCEECSGVAVKHEWALIKGKDYAKKRENFKQLCTSCHHNYDESRRKMWVTRRGEGAY